MKNISEQTFDWANELNGPQENVVSRFVTTLQALAGGPQGYRLRRILLTNFWLYGQQEFEIPHGRLFLAGENASGKSTVLTAALPLALDGDLRPNRLDTFGGRERRIEYYVLGGTDSATPYTFERRTSYIALEFEWCDPDHPPIAPEIRQRWENGDRETTRFLTIGVSIAGNANTTERIRPLRFLITDGSRLGYGLDTSYESGSKHEKRAYDHARFKQILEGHGFVCDSQADYERQVARYLFGYEDVKDFAKLINLLLILRRPNLSTELNFSRVHEYLKLSLPRIPAETTSHVIGTIERIDAIQREIERIQESYDSTERVHRARQHLALARARLSASDYALAYQEEMAAQSRVHKLRKDLQSAERERERVESQVKTLQTEQYQVDTQMKTLEASEGLQVANRLVQVREREHELQEQARLQSQSLAAAEQAVESNRATLERQKQQVQRIQQESAAHLQELATLARSEALWETTAFQLQEARQQIQDLSSRPQIPAVLASLAEEGTAERTTWLRQLEALHQQRESLDVQVQNARALETTRFQELDEARRHFQSVHDQSLDAQQKLDELLKPFLSEEQATEDAELSLDLSGEESSEPQTQDLLARFSSAIAQYRQLIDELATSLAQDLDQAQGELNELQILSGSKMHALSELQALYEQKQAEPEVVPLRSPRRSAARALLAEHGISAHPLYALLDVVPESDPAQLGRLEYLLEDAGLLDALVIAPSQVNEAEALLAAHDLSDCRLNMALFAQLAQSANQGPTSQSPLLRLDQSLFADDPQAASWHQLTQSLLPVLGSSFSSTDADPLWSGLHPDHTWTHGLLQGRVSPGPARYLGRATRIQARQQELAALTEQRLALEQELQELTNQLASYEQQISELQDQQNQLHRVMQLSGLQERYAELAQTHSSMESSRERYQKARQKTQEARQHYTLVLSQLERSSEGHALFATDPKPVQTALLALLTLKNQARTIQNQLHSMLYTWEEQQRLQASLQAAHNNAQNVAHLVERVRIQLVQLQAELSELQQIAAASDAEQLGERLRSLRERAESLADDLESAKLHSARIEERVTNMTSNLTDAETLLTQMQADRQEKEQHFTGHLLSYPAPELAQAQQKLIGTEDAREPQAVQAAYLLLGPQNAPFASQKELLENLYREAYTTLIRTFNQEQSPLLEYGPDMDDQGQVLFLNEQRSRPVELLQILSERIELQRTLLDAEERQLFETFLLQEIAEAIRMQILEAEEWVQQINTVLGKLPLIGEHYALQWKAPDEYDFTRLGSHLARQHRLLRKPAQSLTMEETETLMDAFRHEIQAVRIRQQESPDTNFLEALEQVFDYRDWFHFDVWVTQAGGQRQRLTDRIAGTRSGAEQLFALYVPLFAALGALYRSADHGAPRLLALDEAFDKVSAANTQRIMEFLVSQDFQWIMTGPQVSGAGSKIPASARYLMIHEKGSPVATASSSFWSEKQLTVNSATNGQKK